MAASGLHISISAEPIAHIGGLTISNSILTSLIASALLILLALIVNRSLATTNRPGRLQSMFELVIESLYNLVNGITGDIGKTKKFFPLVATFFLFILFNNWLGLLPGVGTIGILEEPAAIESHATGETAPATHETVAGNPAADEVHEAQALTEAGQAAEATNIDEHATGDTDHDPLPVTDTETVEIEGGAVTSTPGTTELEVADDTHTAAADHGPVFVPIFRAGTADLNTTLALALVSMFSVQVFGFSYQKFAYFKKFIDFSSPIMFFVGILELISEVGKIISFAFRLFGNIFAGEVLLAVIGFLVPLVAPMPFYGLEIFVGFIQGLVFALLSTVFYNVATLGHEEH